MRYYDEKNRAHIFSLGCVEEDWKEKEFSRSGVEPGMKHICIYCKQEKEESEFNTEHVIPQQFGKYNTNAPVLNRFQVCRTCNTAFSHELENIVGMDSIEAISRIQLRKRPMTDGRTLLGKRMKVEIADPRFKGISPKVVTNSSNPERIEFVYEKLIGIHKDSEEDVYDYYAPNEVPDLSEETKECLKRYKTPVFTIGMTKEESLPILKQHGYITDESVFSYLKAEDVFGDTDQINVKMTDVNDPVKRRLAAKTVFNYLCFKFGKEFVLSEKFDAIRNYARYGIWDKDKLWFKMKDSQAFNAKGKDARRISMRLDEFRSRRPIDIIAKTRVVDDSEKDFRQNKTTEDKKKNGSWYNRYDLREGGTNE